MASAEAVARRRANRASRRAAKERQRIVQQGCGGSLQIPMESYLWPEKQTRQRPFELSRAHFRYIKQREKQPWITRASLEAFWQCRACGWTPWPVQIIYCGEPLIGDDDKPVTDDTTWEWFEGRLDPEQRAILVRLTREINRFDRELATSRRAKNHGRHGMREMDPNCR